MVTRTGRWPAAPYAYEVSGEPLRVGLCHCADCHKESVSSFVTFAVWPKTAFTSSGEVKVFNGRGFCPACGSRLFNPAEGETEIHVGSLDDAPVDLIPEYEIWVGGRETWLHPLSVPQYTGDRDHPDQCV